MVKRFVVIVSGCLIGAAWACTPGDEISYGAATDAGSTPDGLTAVPDVATFEAAAPPPPVVLTQGLPCDNTDVNDSGPTTCDQSAGNGCCFKAGGSTGSCIPSGEVTLSCNAGGSIFVTCTSDDPDSACCWGKRDTVFYTRRAVDCGTGAHACDTVNAQCAGGASCVICPGRTFGYCPGTGEAPCN